MSDGDIQISKANLDFGGTGVASWKKLLSWEVSGVSWAKGVRWEWGRIYPAENVSATP